MRIENTQSTLEMNFDGFELSRLNNVIELAKKCGLKIEQEFIKQNVSRYNPVTDEDEDYEESRAILLIKKIDTNSSGKGKIHQKWDEFKNELSNMLPYIRSSLDEPQFARTMQKGVETEFSGKNWTRIWFSKDPNICITQDKLNNIEEFLTAYPDFRITLIFDSHLLNDLGQEHFQKVKDELTQKFPNRIVFSDLRSQEFQSKLQNDTEKALYRFASEELNNIHKGGNVAAASDIVRVLGPSYQAGIYTDFDVSFTDVIFDKFSASSPLVFAMDRKGSCNDVMAIHPDSSKHQNGELLAYQQQMLQNYNDINSEESCLGFAKKLFQNSRLAEVFESKLTLIYNKLDSNIPPLFRLRNALEVVCKTSSNLEFKTLCRYGLMNSVIQISGPGCLPENEIHSYHNGSYNHLSDIVIGSSAGIKNDASWFPHEAEINSQFAVQSPISRIASEEAKIATQQNLKSALVELKEKLKPQESYTRRFAPSFQKTPIN